MTDSKSSGSVGDTDDESNEGDGPGRAKRTRDIRWCKCSTGRIGEYGVIGAEQADESHFDDRSADDEEDEVSGSDGRIRFSTKQLYGRQKELQKLHDLWNIMMINDDSASEDRKDKSNCNNAEQNDLIQNDNRPTDSNSTPHNGDSTTTTTSSSSSPSCVAWIGGYSGSGKSTLITEFVRKMHNATASTSTESPNDFLFLSAKYSQTYQATRFGSHIGSLGTLFDVMDPTTRSLIQQPLYDAMVALDDDAMLLFRIFPGLYQEFGSTLSQQINKNSNNPVVDGSSGGVNNSLSGDFLMSSSLRDSSADDVSSYQGLYHRKKKTISKERLKFVLHTFFRYLCNDKKRPLILFLDDIQWCDDAGFDVIQNLLLDPQLQYLFFIGAYRSNEVDGVNYEEGESKCDDVDDQEQEQHKLIKVISRIDEEQTNKSSSPRALHLSLKELTIDDVGQFIADSLRLDRDQTLPLTQAIFTKTLGNPFFIRQALEQLVRANALYYDTISFEWSWNLQQYELQQLLPDDMINMVKSKLMHLPKDLQQILVVASYTKSAFDVDTLLEVIHPQLALLHTPSSLITTKTKSMVDNGIGNTLPTEKDYQNKRSQLIKLLDQAVMEGLLLLESTTSTTQTAKTAATKIPTGNSDSNPPSPSEELTYCFAHDRIEEAARSFIADCGDRASFLSEIGNALYIRADSKYGEDWMYFAASQNLNSLATLNTTMDDTDGNHNDNNNTEPTSLTTVEKEEEEQRRLLRLAELNNRTAELSFEYLAFTAALDYCKYGIWYLKRSSNNSDDFWMNQYPLALSLYTIGADAEYGLGNVEGALEYCEEILKHKDNRRTIFDILPAYKVQLDIMSGKGELSEAYDLSFGILREMGFTYPEGKRMQRLRAWSNLRQVRARYIPTEKLINDMPNVSDPILIETFEFLQKAGSFAYQAENIPIYVLVCCEAVKWMSKNGLTDGSASAVASFANVLMHVYGDFDTSARLAELAILITNRLKKKFNEPRALNTSNAFVLSWVRPLRTRLKYHARAYESGVVSGNIEGSSVAKFKSSWTMMYAGMPLFEVESLCRSGVPELRKWECTFDSNLMSMVFQASLNLQGESDNTTRLVGEAMDETISPFSDMPFKMVVDIWKRYLCVFFGEWEEGAKNALEAGDICSKKMSGMMFGMETLIRGLLLCGMARKTKETKYKKAFQQVFKQLKELVRKGCVNLVGPTKLLEAEHAAMAGTKRQARSAFEESISICKTGQFHQYAGLANERYAMFLLEVGESSAFRDHTSQAIECYRKWGAKRKVALLEGTSQTNGTHQ